MHNKLVEIPFNEWPELRELYSHKKVESCGYYALQIMGDWAVKSPEIGIKIYSLNGQWREDGTFIAIMPLFSNVICNTLLDDLSSLKLALSVLDTKPLYRFFGFPERLVPAIKEYFNYCGLTEEAFKPDSTAWYHISKEKAKQFEISPPPGITLKPIDPSYNIKINSFWAHRYMDSEFYVKHLLQFNDSVGAFDSQGKLVAWCLRLPTGSLGLLQVKETHRRQGLGSLVVKYMAKLMADRDEEVRASVIFSNRPSEAMFEHLGFSPVDKAYWVEKPKIA